MLMRMAIQCIEQSLLKRGGCTARGRLSGGLCTSRPDLLLEAGPDVAGEGLARALRVTGEKSLLVEW
ncbi:hypothetical protein [Thermogemmatispora sp.]|uniref:hypothetical protein n=1 Tax=Thermogemmatispora sp. TaxID=1968838 RepID=UPI0035E43CA4